MQKGYLHETRISSRRMSRDNNMYVGFFLIGVAQKRHNLIVRVNTPLTIEKLSAMQLRSQRPLHVQGVAGHPG
jgi:hypothetical protein